jgi:hypothetical protein
MPGEHLVHDHRGHRVVDGTVVHDHHVQRVTLAESLEHPATAPQRRDRHVPGVGQMEDHRDAGLGQSRPNRVVRRVTQ